MERYIFIVIVSLIFASAMKCLVDSENKKEFLFRRSRCSSCHKELRGSDLIPIFSYLFKKGRCSYCNQKIPLDVFLYEIFTFITIVLFIIFQNHFVFISYLEVSIFIILIFLGIEDVKSFEVNDELFYLLIILNFSSIYTLLFIQFFRFYLSCYYFSYIIYFHKRWFRLWRYKSILCISVKFKFIWGSVFVNFHIFICRILRYLVNYFEKS